MAAHHHLQEDDVLPPAPPPRHPPSPHPPFTGVSQLLPACGNCLEPCGLPHRTSAGPKEERHSRSGCSARWHFFRNARKMSKPEKRKTRSLGYYPPAQCKIEIAETTAAMTGKLRKALGCARPQSASQSSPSLSIIFSQLTVQSSTQSRTFFAQ